MKKIIPIIMAVVVIMAMLTGCSFFENNHLLGTDKINALETTEAAETPANPEPAQANTKTSADVDASSATATGAAAIEVSAKVEPAQPVAQPEPVVFVLIDLSDQWLWVLKGPKVTDDISRCVVVYESGIVSGTADTECATPTGLYMVNNNKKDGTFLYPSDGGKVWVDYWMPFIDNEIGMHDASRWRDDDEFGTDQYRYSGSHGCINLPFDSAAAIYHLVRVGTPVYVVD